MVDAFINNLTQNLANGSWAILLSMFGVGLLESFNPCTGAMLPLVAGGTRQGGYSKILMFSGGYTLTLASLGLLAATIGRVLTLPGWFWSIFLGLLYLLTGLSILRVRLPVSVTGFYVLRNNWPGVRFLLNKEGLNPMALGVVFGLAPSPCTVPVVMAVSAFTVASGKVLFGALALGFFGLGHSIILALAFLPAIRRHSGINRFFGSLRPVLGMVLILIAIYFLVWQPDLAHLAEISRPLAE